MKQPPPPQNGTLPTAKTMRTPWWQWVFIAAAVVGAYLLFGCPVRFFTGFACPGCGMTHAWLLAATGQFPQALAHHPLFWLVPFLAVAALLPRERTSRSRVRMVLLWGGCAAFVVVYLLRLFLWRDPLLQPETPGLWQWVQRIGALFW